ncbi:hypothetical protein NDU88_002724 [Pleurodeles waltl]|uniref:Uncharacterized protein n=1 Tax=Pleurodeles waltl TaxID=8319 RepID=A0AAV7NEF0_PLEWA|nr:hypothetical protein NDU88_002724 [Pleurodeles waltl]
MAVLCIIPQGRYKSTPRVLRRGAAPLEVTLGCRTRRKVKENAGKLREDAEQLEVDASIKETAQQQKWEEEDVNREEKGISPNPRRGDYRV